MGLGTRQCVIVIIINPCGPQCGIGPHAATCFALNSVYIILPYAFATSKCFSLFFEKTGYDSLSSALEKIKDLLTLSLRHFPVIMDGSLFTIHAVRARFSCHCAIFLSMRADKDVHMYTKLKDSLQAKLDSKLNGGLGRQNDLGLFDIEAIYSNLMFLVRCSGQRRSVPPHVCFQL